MDDVGLLAAAVVPYLLLVFGFAAYCVIDIYRSASVRHLPKWVWGLLCVGWAPFGGVVYLFVGRDR
jgi:hypothetical protein